MALPICTQIPNLKGVTKIIFFKLSRPKGNLCGSVTLLNPKYPHLSSGDTMKLSNKYTKVNIILIYLSPAAEGRGQEIIKHLPSVHPFLTFLHKPYISFLNTDIFTKFAGNVYGCKKHVKSVVSF